MGRVKKNLRRIRKSLRRRVRGFLPARAPSTLEGAAAAAYSAAGWNGLAAFTREPAWRDALRFEREPERAFDEAGRLIPPAAGRDELVARKLDLLLHVCSPFEKEPIDYLEFGVRGGTSLAAVVGRLGHDATRFYGFDTFEGLPESWVSAWGRSDLAERKPGIKQEGTFAVARMPEFADPRVELVKGTFQATLGDFLSRRPPIRRKLVNIDSDLYSAALFVLTRLHPFLESGDRVYFDEFYDALGEFAAFNDYVRSHYVKDRFRLIGRAYDACAFEVVAPGSSTAARAEGKSRP